MAPGCVNARLVHVCFCTFLAIISALLGLGAFVCVMFDSWQPSGTLYLEVSNKNNSCLHFSIWLLGYHQDFFVKISAFAVLGGLVTFLGSSGWLLALQAPAGMALTGLPAPVASHCRCMRIWAPSSFEALKLESPQFRVFACQRKAASELSAMAIEPSLSTIRAAWVQPHDTCCCCLAAFEEESAVAVLPCGHVFHEDCIVAWSLTPSDMSGSCPVCRRHFGASQTESCEVLFEALRAA